MLNRHAIVLFLGTAAILALAPAPVVAIQLIGVSDLVMLAGLLLDLDQPGPRAIVARGLQAGGAALAFAAAARASSSPPLALAEAGIALAVLGVVLEMAMGYGALRLGIAAQATGDAIYLVGFALALAARGRAPSPRGWVFIAISGAISALAAAYNLQLQLRRLRDLQAGWRYRVLSTGGQLLRLSTPTGQAEIAWSDVRAVERLDRRHLLLVLPSPLSPEVACSGLPLDQLSGAGESDRASTAGAEQYGFILHEQEIGRALPQAEEEFRRLAVFARGAHHARCAKL